MSDLTHLMICGGHACDCAETVDVNDTVVTPDGTGTVEVLLEHEASVRLDREAGDGGVWRQRYKLSAIHLTESAGAMKD